jgi:hypothetical protein
MFSFQKEQASMSFSHLTFYKEVSEAYSRDENSAMPGMILGLVTHILLAVSWQHQEQALAHGSKRGTCIKIRRKDSLSPNISKSRISFPSFYVVVI